MATAPSNLPLFYNKLDPLSSSVHGNFKTRPSDTAPFLANAHAVPLTSDEFIVAQRFYPIVFSVGDAPVPLALMGLNEGVNVYIDDDGRPTREVYIPAYARRYPFMLARLKPDAEELSLCFDATSNVVGDFADGEPLFEDGKPTQTTNDILKFCEEFELSAQRTNAFMQELAELDLLIDGEVSIQPADSETPFVYRGFRMVAEDKLRDMRGDTLRKINQNGILPLVVAHLFSLQLIRDVFARQLQLGKMPVRTPEPIQA